MVRVGGWIRALAARWRDWLVRRQAADTLGRRGEAAAERYLRQLGYRLVARSDRGGLGEIDLVAVDGRVIVFVEVKTRRSDHCGEPAEAVDAPKQRRLTRLALGWLKRHDLLEQAARFDVIAITWPDPRQPPRIEHIRGAFEAVGRGQWFG